MAAPITRRVALVTGCGKREGLGAAIATALAAAGLTVAVTDLLPGGVRNTSELPSDVDPEWPGLEGLTAAIRRGGAEALALLGDVTSEKDAERMVGEVVGHYGRFDVLVNNAAAPQGVEYADIEDISLRAWENLMAVNVTGTFLMSRAAVPQMRSQSWGRIINISSVAGKRGFARQVAYSASKHAVLGLTRSLALDVATSSITVNAICPGPTRTSRTINSVRRDGIEEVEQELARRAAALPVGRYGEPYEVAAAAVFLASEAAGFLTGQAISVDGGMLPA
jgi:3-oxoacyl-[acyl-carrier protein] reductase